MFAAANEFDWAKPQKPRITTRLSENKMKAEFWAAGRAAALLIVAGYVATISTTVMANDEPTKVTGPVGSRKQI
jgi:hypothetical protein